MEKIAKSQTLGDAEKLKYMRGQRSLEINPRHPLIKELKSQVSPRLVQWQWQWQWQVGVGGG
jgi:hypothetical protein